VTVTPQLKAIVLAGVLAVLALGLGFMTLSMNQAGASDSVPPPITPLKQRAAALTPAKAASADPKPKPKPKAKPKPPKAGATVPTVTGDVPDAPPASTPPQP
jgi:hypothetical protein